MELDTKNGTNIGEINGLKIEIPVEITADLSETINNVYEDALSPGTKGIGKTFGIISNFFNNTVLLPMQKYNLYAEDKLRQYAIQLENKAKEEIPIENLIEPKINILGNTLEALKYNFNEENIKEMFTNILISNIDNRKQNKVLPSYINVIKELSKEDAILLKKFKDNNCNAFYMIQLRCKSNNSNGYKYLDKYICTHYERKENTVGFSSLKLNELVIDNLQRVGLIKIDFEYAFTDMPEIYNKLEKSCIPQQNDSYLEYSSTHGIFSLTEYGKNFIDICLS